MRRSMQPVVSSIRRAPPCGGFRVGVSVLLAALALACTGSRRERHAATQPAEVLVEVLPRGAEVAIDGRTLGTGSRTSPAPPGAGEHVLSVRAEGFEPLDQTLPAQSLAGVRLAVALRPLGFGSARSLDYDDPEGLAAAGAHLVRAGDARDALDYAGRAAALDPSMPLPARVTGDAWATLGDRRRAAEAWTRYLNLAPNAPDAARVMRDLETAGGDGAVP